MIKLFYFASFYLQVNGVDAAAKKAAEANGGQYSTHALSVVIGNQWCVLV